MQGDKAYDQRALRAGVGRRGITVRAPPSTPTPSTAVSGQWLQFAQPSATRQRTHHPMHQHDPSIGPRPDFATGIPQSRNPIRDRGSRYTATFDAILANEAVVIVQTSIRVPRMNASMTRRGTDLPCELLDSVIVNGSRFPHALCVRDLP